MSEFADNTNLGKLDNIIGRLLSDIHTGNLKVIDTIHAKIHESKMFVVSQRFEGVANDADIEILIKTGSIGTHGIFKIATDGKSYIDAYENTTVSGDGTPIPERNKNRYGSDSAGFSVFHTPTIDTDGDIILNEVTVGGQGGQKVGSVTDDRDEFVLKSDTNYLLRITNKSGTGSDFNIFLSLYEASLL